MKTKQEQRKKGFNPFGGKQELFISFKLPHQKIEPRINEPIGQGKSALAKCWRCGGDHYLNSCPKKKNKDARVYNLNEKSIVGDVAHNIPRIYAAL